MNKIKKWYNDTKKANGYSDKLLIRKIVMMPFAIILYGIGLPLMYLGQGIILLTYSLLGTNGKHVDWSPPFGKK